MTPNNQHRHTSCAGGPPAEGRPAWGSPARARTSALHRSRPLRQLLCQSGILVDRQRRRMTPKTIMLPAEIYDRVEQLAQAEGKTVDEVAVEAVKSLPRV